MLVGIPIIHWIFPLIPSVSQYNPQLEHTLCVSHVYRVCEGRREELFRVEYFVYRGMKYLLI